MAPFNADGGIHFATCKRGKQKKIYRSMDDLMCPTCEEMGLYVFMQPTAAGDRLAYVCDKYHKHFIPITPEAKALINADWRQVERILEPWGFRL